VVGSTQRRIRPNKPDKLPRTAFIQINAATICEIRLMFVIDWRLNQRAQFKFWTFNGDNFASNAT
jgi:hypothetical protein